MKITFYNEVGSVVFGGGKTSSRFKIIEIDGLGFCGKSYDFVSYYNTDGQDTISEKIMPRTVTIKGDFEFSDNTEEFAEALSVLNKKGTLEVESGNIKRKIDARCTDFLQGERQGKFLPFSIQFICDEPYFESSTAYMVPVYRTIPNINSEFSFPDYFSKRISRRNLFIDSNAETEPIFLIVAGNNPIGEMEIVNHTSGERLKINYEPFSNDYITVDVKNRKIYNQAGESLISYLSDDSFFDGFHLYPGDNDVEVLIGTANDKLDVVCKYNNKYLEAVC